MRPAISIILPAYNRAGTIRSSAESVLRQTWTDFELLIVDDCSEDDTLAQARALADPRVRVLSTARNSGPSGARNAGLAEARGTWVAFQDSDDEWLPEKLARQMHRVDSRGHADVAAYCGMIILGSAQDTDAAQRAQVRYHPAADAETVEGDLSGALLSRSLISTQTLMARRDILDRIGGFDTDLPALVDWECALRLSDHGGFAFVDAPLVVQNFSSNSVTRDRWRRAAARRLIVDKHAARFAAAPQTLARHWRSIAGEERRMGETAKARASLSRARALRPFDPRLWALSLWLGLRG